MFFNQVQIIGFVGNDPQVKELPNGNKIAMFSVATEKKFKNKNGELITKTTWHQCAAYGKLAENVVAPYVKKGSHVQVIGELEKQEFTNSKGVEVQTYQINVTSINLFSTNSKNGKTNHQASNNSADGLVQQQSQNNDDDIPF